MFAAMKGTIVDAVVYCGEDELMYPDWFYECILDACFIDDYGSKHVPLSDETDDVFSFTTLVPYESVILRNKYDDLSFTTFKIFNEYYIPMGLHKAALIENCVEFFIHTNKTPLIDYPGWFGEMVKMGNIARQYGTLVYYGDDGEVAMSPKCVFLRNHRGLVRYMEPEEFDKLFSVSSNDLFRTNMRTYLELKEIR